MITAAVLDKIPVFLTPLFRDVAPDDNAAREAARSTLASYDARDDRELRFATLSISFSFGALDALSRAADPELPPNQVLRLRGNANALSRAALQNEARLEKARRQPAGQAEDALPQQAATAGERLLLPQSGGPDVDLPASGATQDLVDFVRAAWKAKKVAAAAAPAAVPVAAPMSRQQRRGADAGSKRGPEARFAP